MPPAMPESLWAATAPPGPECPPLESNDAADVVVVGAGYTGLSAALHLAGAGRRVVVLDAGEPGWGCSGRNGGQVNPGGVKILPEDIAATLGPVWGERFLEFGDRSCDLVFELIERYRIDCEALRPGYVQGGYGAKGRQFNQEWARQWTARGREARFLEREEIADLIGTRRYGSGMHDARGGSVQPLAYARGLARAATQEGAVIHGASAATAIVRDGAGWSVRTARASVGCECVVLATNGYTGELWPGLRQSVVPVASFVTATAPLGHNVLPSVLPGRHAVSETRTNHRVLPARPSGAVHHRRSRPLVRRNRPRRRLARARGGAAAVSPARRGGVGVPVGGLAGHHPRSSAKVVRS